MSRRCEITTSFLNSSANEHQCGCQGWCFGLPVWTPREAAEYHGWWCTWTARRLTRSAEVSPLPSLAGLLSRGGCRSMDRKLCVNVPGTQRSCHMSLSPSLRFPHLQNSPPTVLLSSATSPPWPQEPALGEVCAALGNLWCQGSANGCSWQIWVCNPTTASDFSAVGLSLGLQQTQKMQNKTTASGRFGGGVSMPSIFEPLICLSPLKQPTLPTTLSLSQHPS